MPRTSHIFYNKREFINPEDSHYTGSICCFDGIVSNQSRSSERYCFVEFSDCHDKVRIHTDRNAGNEDEILMQYIEKLGKVVKQLQEFQLHLISTLDIELPDLENVYQIEAGEENDNA